MSYIDKIMERANIQIFRKYLLHGERAEDSDYQSKEKRLEEAYHNCLNIIKKYDSAGENSELYSEIMKSIATYEDVYTEIGFQSGFKFLNSIISKTDTIQLSQYKKYKQLNTIIEKYNDILSNDTNINEEIRERINLQSIGYYLKEGSNLLKPDKTCFTDRKKKAELQLENGLIKILDEKTFNKIYPLIINYASTKEEIQFSIGMKTGAKLALLLTDNSECDY